MAKDSGAAARTAQTAQNQDKQTAQNTQGETREQRRQRRLREFVRSSVGACETLLGRKVTGVDMPGGHRQSIRIKCGDEGVIVTRRPNPKRARLEVSTLYALGSHGGPVPKVLAFDGIWLLQEDLGPERLAQAVHNAAKNKDDRKGEELVLAAVKSVDDYQNAAASCGFERNVIVIGTDPKWMRTVLDMPARLGRLLRVPAPPLPVDPLLKMIRVRRPYFIKWDARPGNAIVRPDGSVAWFDWEHAGCRNRLDDLVWMLADEYMPDWPKAVDEALERHIESFAQGMASRDEALDYFYTFGTLHACVRMSLIMTSKKDGPWWNPEKSLAGDKVGVIRPAMLACLKRAARWADRAPLLKPLVPWLKSLPERVPPENPPKAA